MDDKKAATILLSLSDKHSLDNEEREAIKTAVGILSWTCLSKSRIKAQKDKRSKDMKWQ